jgi:2',3'-cyclic-nucleotide 2'-phosphodiesterase (5'-nucleotidase family)
MQMSNRRFTDCFLTRRNVSLLVLTLFVLTAMLMTLPAAASGFFGLVLQKPKPRPQSDREKLAKNPRPSGSMKERLAEDDGYGLALFYSADIGGNLEVCGCPIHPLGGVARRIGYINAFRKRSPDAGTLMVDVGHIFSDETNEEKTALRDDAVLMNDWIVKANEAMNLDVVNLSHRDLRYASALLRPTAKLKPEKSSIISANIRINPRLESDPLPMAPAPYVIKTVTAKRLSKPVTIAFIGVSEFVPAEQKAAIEQAGFIIEDPAEAVKRVLPEVKDKVDVTAVVGYLRYGLANKIAMQNADLDLIIAADGSGLVPDPKQVNNALIVYAAKQTKYLGELRFYTDKEGIVEKFTTRYVELDEVIADDAPMLQMTQAARQEIDVVQRRVAEEIALKHLSQGDRPSIWVTAETCGKCHVQEYDLWKKSRHSHAFDGLVTKSREFDESCVGCHSVGFKKEGFINIKATPQFANVQCESCHGAGTEHIKDPKAGNYKTPPAPNSCLACHDPENSPDFVFSKYWPEIKHWNSLKPGAAAQGRKSSARRVRK